MAEGGTVGRRDAPGIRPVQWVKNRAPDQYNKPGTLRRRQGGVELTARADCGGLRAMAHDAQEFSRLVEALVMRFFAQHGVAVPAVVRTGEFASRLWRVVAEPGASPPAGGSENAEAVRVARVVAAGEDPLLSSAAQQLLKACLYPELGVCRDSFRAVAEDGSCRRQELARVRGRISGTHCVDCPHWLALSPARHAGFLQAEWRRGAREFSDHQAEFLPEDFRALRRWLHAWRRVSPSGAR